MAEQKVRAVFGKMRGYQPPEQGNWKDFLLPGMQVDETNDETTWGKDVDSNVAHAILQRRKDEKLAAERGITLPPYTKAALARDAAAIKADSEKRKLSNEKPLSAQEREALQRAGVTPPEYGVKPEEQKAPGDDPLKPMTPEDKALRKEQQQFGMSTEVINRAMKELGLKNAKDYAADQPAAQAANEAALKKGYEGMSPPEYKGPMPKAENALPANIPTPPMAKLDLPQAPGQKMMDAMNQRMMMQQAQQGGRPPAVAGPLAMALGAMAANGVGGMPGMPPGGMGGMGGGMPGGMGGMMPPRPEPRKPMFGPDNPPPATLDNGRSLASLTGDENAQLDQTAQTGGSRDFIAQLRKMRQGGTGIVGGVGDVRNGGGDFDAGPPPPPGGIQSDGGDFDSAPGLADLAKKPGGLYINLQPGGAPDAQDAAPPAPGAMPGGLDQPPPWPPVQAPNLADLLRKAMQANQGQ